MKPVLAILLFVATGCVSIGTHERMLREVRAQDFRDMQKWVLQFQAGEISADDLVMLIQARESVLQMRNLSRSQ